ncbi:MAG TPA: ParB/RepB/Spo0J family partition protein [Thermoleophilaceae bacterium]|nr:ParB/RepB/Spo0J family partition protein [Thermoleophilaceae bacterium]
MPEQAAAKAAGSTANRGMGRGLAAILTRAVPEEDVLRQLPVDLIRANEHQPRKEFEGDALLALEQSIRANGILQPLVVRPLPGGTYELIAGERRLRAAKMAELDTVPAIVRETADDERLALALVENVVREDLNPVEEARACAMAVEDLGLTKEDLAKRLGRNRVTVSNLIRLLSLPDDVLAMLERRELSEGHGRALLVCHDHTERRRLARAAADAGWSVRELERRARAAQAGDVPSKARRELHPDLSDALAAAGDALTAALGREVKVKPKGARFRVELEVEDPAEAVALAERLLR